jgi:hypothetical protein
MITHECFAVVREREGTIEATFEKKADAEYFCDRWNQKQKSPQDLCGVVVLGKISETAVGAMAAHDARLRMQALDAAIQLFSLKAATGKLDVDAIVSAAAAFHGFLIGTTVQIDLREQKVVLGDELPAETQSCAGR